MTTTSFGPGEGLAAHRDANDRGTYGGRFPAFIGLALRHGGVYTEDTDGMTVEEALHRANLDYDVQVHEGISLPVVGLGGVTTVDYPNHRGTVRVNHDGTVAPTGFGIVKSRYAPVAPRAALTGIGQQILDDFGANVVAVGEYGDPVGQKFYAAFKLPQHIEIGGNDRTDLYLNLLGSHDGSSSLQALLAPLRLSCTNQVAATFGRAVQKITVRHTGTPMVRVDEARRILGMVNAWTEAFTSIAEGMLATKVTDGEFEDIVKREFLTEPDLLATKRTLNSYARKLESLNALFRSADTQDFGRNTAYGAYNAVVEWLDHAAPVRGGDERRFARIMDGDTDRLKAHALDVFAAV